MAIFIKKKWKDVVAQYPDRRRIEKIDGLTDVYKVNLAIDVIEEGNKFEASELNDLEDRIEQGFNAASTQVEIYANSAFASAQDASKSNDSARENSENAKKWAIGSEIEADAQYNNNAKYYAEQSSISSISASDSANTANIAMGTAESYATSALNYKNESRTNADNASFSASQASTDRLVSEGYALGTQDGVPVTSGEYYQNNAKWYAEHSSSTSKLVDLQDVTISDLKNNQVIIYNEEKQKWVNSDYSGGTGTNDYESLVNHPKINGTELIGDKSAADIGLYSKPSSGIPKSDLSEEVVSLIESKQDKPVVIESSGTLKLS